MTDIRTEVRNFLKETGIPPSTFGRRALGDPSFMRHFREGRPATEKTQARLRSFMAHHMSLQKDESDA